MQRVWLLLLGVWTYAAMAAGPLPDLGIYAGGNGGFAEVLGPRELEFPQDHGPHPQYRQEWWYLTGNLDSADGQRFGFELTFFRFALAPGWAAETVEAVAGDRSGWRTGQIYMAHFAITDVAQKRFRFEQKLSRGAVGLSGARTLPLRVWLDDWALEAVTPGIAGSIAGSGSAVGLTAASGGPGEQALSTAGAGVQPHWRLHAAENGYELTLDAEALQQPALNGDRGFSRKSDDRGSASFYYSIPRVAVEGRLVRDGKPIEVKGLAWLDREWGSGTLSRSEQGWDWFALQLNDGSALMFYALRHQDGRRDRNSAGTWVDAAGKAQSLTSEQVQIDVIDYWVNPRGARYPAHWRVRVPTRGVDVEVRPVIPNQELTGSTRYWEGAVDVTGARSGQQAAGRGYVELVGYAAQ